nr:hypothetical protein [Tanacetum cinerariifolium]
MDAFQELANLKANGFCDSPLLGVNTPRSDEDRLKLMELMVFLMKKGVCDEFGLNAARLSKFLLSGKCDVTRLQALVDKKRIVINEEVVREILQLNDAEGQRFNFLKYIFESLVCNVDSSSKFYMYPRFIQLIIQTHIVDLSKHTNRYISPVLTQKVFVNMRRVGKGFSGVETPLFETMLAVRDIAEEAEAQVPAQGNDVHKHAAEEVATDVVPPTPTSPSPSSPVISSLPPHQSPCPPQPQDAEGSSHLFQQVLDTCSALVLRVEGLENANAAQQLEIVKLKARVKKLEKINKGRNIVDMDQDEGIELVVDQEKDAEVEGRHADKQAEIYNINLDHSSKVLSMQEDDTEVQEAVEVITTAKFITEVVNTAATQVVAASTPIPAAKPKILKIAAAPAVSTRRRKGVEIRDPEEELHIDTPAETPTMKDKGKGILIEVPKHMKKKDQVEMDAEYAKKLQKELDKEREEAYKNIDWNVALDHVQSKEPQYIKRNHGIKKKPQSESEARKNMISYLKNTEGYKMEFFKGKMYDQILPIFQARHPLLRFTLEQLVNVERLQVEEESEMSLELLRVDAASSMPMRQTRLKRIKMINGDAWVKDGIFIPEWVKIRRNYGIREISNKDPYSICQKRGVIILNW